MGALPTNFRPASSGVRLPHGRTCSPKRRTISACAVAVETVSITVLRNSQLTRLAAIPDTSNIPTRIG